MKPTTNGLAAAVYRNANDELRSALDSLAPRRLPSQERGRSTFELILSTASHILVTEGSDVLSVDLIAERSRLSVGAVYGFFPNKHSIVNQLAFRTLEKFCALFDSSATSTATSIAPDDVLATLLERIKRSAEVWMDPVAITVWYNMNSTPEMRVALKRYDAVIARLLAVEIAPLLPDVGVPERSAIAIVLLAAVIGSLDAAISQPRLRTRIVEVLPKLVVGLLREHGARID